MLSIVVKLYPNAMQRKRIQEHIDASRYVYNYCLGYRIKLYEDNKTSISAYDLRNHVTALKQLEEHYWLKGVDSQVLQQAVMRLDKAYRNFFRRVRNNSGPPGFPRFKSRRETTQSYTHTQSIRFNNTGTKIKLPLIGYVRCRGYRDIPGVIKQCTIKSHSDGTITACVSVANENQVAANTNYDSIGIDVGTRKFLTDSRGHMVQPYDYSKILTKIKYQHQRLARLTEFTNNRQRTKNYLAKLYRKLTNKRKDNLHKLANQYRGYRNVYVENLDIQKMVKNTVGTVDTPNKDSVRKTRLNHNITTQAWGMFFNILNYKLLQRASKLYRVDPMYTSQRCSVCGSIHKDNRDKEKFLCLACGNTMDADHNAAINIEMMGYNVIGHIEQRVG